VFENLGLVVDLVPAVSEFTDQEGLEQAVPPDHQDRGGATGLGQGDRSVAFVHHQALVGELADRLRSRGRRHTELLGEHLRGDLLGLPFLPGPDDLQIVLGDRRELGDRLEPGQGGSVHRGFGRGLRRGH
jgi:hypothetical protein